MITTTTINPDGKGDNTHKKKSVAAYAATAAAAAGAGVAGAAIVSDLNNKEDAVAEVVEGNAVTPETSGTPPSQSSTAEQSTSATTGQTSTSTASQTTTTAESEPITEEVSSATDVEEVIEEVSGPTDTTTEEVVEDITEPTDETTTAGDIIEQVDNSVNPDEIADAIISEDQIDPNDIDMADVVNFDEIGTVYTVDGESYTAATFHDAAGNNLVMVDVDGDDVFDVITDHEGNLIADVPGTMTVDDAEIGVADDGTYLAHNDDENTDEFGADTISQDILA